MPLSHEHVGSKIVAKIKIYTLARAELLFNLCYEIPCITLVNLLEKLERAIKKVWGFSGTFPRS